MARALYMLKGPYGGEIIEADDVAAAKIVTDKNGVYLENVTEATPSGVHDKTDYGVTFKSLNGYVPAPAAQPPQQPAQQLIVANGDQVAKTITISGGPADKAYTVTVVYAVDGGADVTVTQAVAKGQTAAQVATALAAKIVGAMTATAAGGVVTMVKGTAATGALTKLETTVA